MHPFSFVDSAQKYFRQAGPLHLQVRKPPRVVDFTLATGELIFPIEQKDLPEQMKADNLALG